MITVDKVFKEVTITTECVEGDVILELFSGCNPRHNIYYILYTLYICIYLNINFVYTFTYIRNIYFVYRVTTTNI